MAKDCERPEKFLEVADLYEMLREAKASIMTAPSPEKAMGFLDVLVMLVKNQGADIAGKFYGVQHLLGSAALVAEKLHRDMPETVEKEDGKRMQHLARSLVRAVQSMSNSPEIPNTKASPQESIVAQPPAPTSASSAEMNLAYQSAPTSSAVGRVIKSAAQTETLDAALEQLDLQGSGANSSQTNLMATPPPLLHSSYFTPPPGAKYHPDGKPIGPFGPAKVKLPAASWVLAHLDWTAVQLVDGSWAWFPTPVLQKNGYDVDGAHGVPPPTVDNNDGLEGADDEDGLEDTNDEDANDDSNEGAIDEDNEFFDPDDEM